MISRMFAKAVFVIAASLSASGAALAAGEAKPPEHHHWHFAGPVGSFDQAQLQRGLQVYREVCASCHALEHISFRNFGEKGGPFYDKQYPNPNDNPYVRAVAAEAVVVDGPDDDGDMFERAGRPADKVPGPYANEQLARLSNGGALPPDLSIITKARHHGTDYVRSLMLGYVTPPEGKEPTPGLYYNPYFAGDYIAMAPQLTEGRVTYAEGQPEATPEQMAEDVTAFLTWAADPHADARKRLGFIVMGYLVVFAILLWLSYKQIWKNVKH